MKILPNIHPGEILLEEFLRPRAITQKQLASAISISATRISRLINGKSRIDAEVALRLSKYFGNSAGFWLGLQADFDLEEESSKRKPR